MSASDDLENLDHKTLRAKFLQYGLPNVPITDTSKKILIKKLRAAMDGGSITKGGKGRRETMHVTSTTTNNTERDEGKPSKGTNRRTIAVVRKEKEEIRTATPIEKRRSSRATPIQETSIPISISRKSTPVVIEETDFDDDFMLIDQHVPVVTNIPIHKKSRSPSLSKSVVVTTSYKKDLNLKDDKIEEEETEEEGFNEKHKEYNLSRQFASNIDARNNLSPRITFSQHTPSSDKNMFPGGYKPIYPNLNDVDNFTNSKTTYESSSTVTKRTIAPSSIRPPSLSRKSVEVETSRRNKASKYVENSDSNNDDDDVVQKAPYLSDFARRLSNLKAEKLDLGVKKDLYRDDSGYIRNLERRSYKSNTSQGGVGDSLRQLWSVLDRKYKIKRFVLIVTILTAIILFIYFYYLKI